MTKAQKALTDFRASQEYQDLVRPSDEKSGNTNAADLELKLKRAFMAGWINDRVNLSTLLDELAGSQPTVTPAKK